MAGNVAPDVLASLPPHWVDYDATAGTMRLNTTAFINVDSHAKAGELVEILGGALQVDHVTHSWIFQTALPANNYIGG